MKQPFYYQKAEYRNFSSIFSWFTAQVNTEQHLKIDRLIYFDLFNLLEREFNDIIILFICYQKKGNKEKRAFHPICRLNRSTRK